MHCPRCGQEQITADTKFCSRCGFQLAIVAELLAFNGKLPQLEASAAPLLTKKTGVVFAGFWFILFTLLLTSIAGILDLGNIPGLTAVTGLFGSILILIASLVLLPSSRSFRNNALVPENFRERSASLHGKPDAQRLAGGTEQPAAFYTAPQGNWRAPDTGELATPGSVTDNTTKLLSIEQEK